MQPDQQKITHQYAGVLLLTTSGKVIGQRRDDIPTIDDPGKTSIFGGAIEEGEEPRMAAWRELVQEETNLQLRVEDLKPFWEVTAWRAFTKEWERRYFFTATI